MMTFNESTSDTPHCTLRSAVLDLHGRQAQEPFGRVHKLENRMLEKQCDMIYLDALTEDLEHHIPQDMPFTF